MTYVCLKLRKSTAVAPKDYQKKPIHMLNPVSNLDGRTLPIFVTFEPSLRLSSFKSTFCFGKFVL